MKLVKLKMPLRNAEAFAAWLFNNAMMPLVTYSESELFDAHLIAIIAIKDEQLVTFSESDYAKFLIK